MKLEDLVGLVIVWLAGTVVIGAYLGLVGAIAWRVMQWIL